MEIENFFTKRGFGQKLGFGKRPAVCVIEMIKAFTDPTFPLGMNQDQEIIVINNILAVAHNKNVPVFFGIVCYQKENFSDAGLWLLKQSGLKTLKYNSEEVKIDQRISKSENDSMISRHYASMFFGTDFLTQLNFNRVDTLIITGCSTSGCIRATAVDGISHGYRPIVVMDAVADRDKDAHQQSLIDLETRYADVVESGEVIEYLTSLTREEYDL